MGSATATLPWVRSRAQARIAQALLDKGYWPLNAIWRRAGDEEEAPVMNRGWWNVFYIRLSDKVRYEAQWREPSPPSDAWVFDLDLRREPGHGYFYKPRNLAEALRWIDDLPPAASASTQRRGVSK